MNMQLPILSLALAGLFAVDAMAQSVDRAPRRRAGTVAKADTATAQVSELLRIAASLRSSGRADIAKTIEAQAKKLWATDGQGRRGAAPQGIYGRLIEDGRVVPVAPAKARGRKPPTAPRASLPGMDPRPTKNIRGGETHRRVPQKFAPGSVGIADQGRDRLKYVRLKTDKDAEGRVRWRRGLPGVEQAPPAAPPGPSDLKSRVKSLQAEVKRMRATLERLNVELEAKKSRHLLR